MPFSQFLAGFKRSHFIMAAAAAFGLYILALGNGWLGVRYHTETIIDRARPGTIQKQRNTAQADAHKQFTGAVRGKQILFGDLHVHTTYSPDAFSISLPVQSGEGAHPPSDACNYARYCSALDFWSINDHAEAISAWQWEETKEAIRQCNKAGGDPKNPDMVSFLGWEWTQVGSNPGNHYGHKNVVLLETADDKVPARPIASSPPPGSPVVALHRGTSVWQRVGIGLTAPVAPGPAKAYFAATRFFADQASRSDCDMTKNVHELPKDCTEAVATPAELFARLGQWNTPTIVIPHGTTWGFYTPRGSDWSKQLKGKMHDPDVQSLIEIFSGHGNAEEYRSYREAVQTEDGEWVCAQPVDGYLPGCVRAGQIIRERCLKQGQAESKCSEVEKEAQQVYVDAMNVGHVTVTGEEPSDWLDAGQCTDCYLPAFNHRVLGSVQYIMALTNFDGDKPRRFNFGFIGSSDNHFARPGTGFKEYQRIGITESTYIDLSFVSNFMDSPLSGKKPEAVPVNLEDPKIHPLFMVETERQSSYFTTGGLIAVHSNGRDRQAIWDAMQRKEVYATSGDRILLWFDLQNGPEGKEPMGASVTMQKAPSFKVTALGSFVQKPGCPSDSVQALGEAETKRLCHGECYHPSDKRKKITRIEIVKITPQQYKNEPVDKLIQDTYRTYECPESQTGGCSFTFTDAGYTRDSVYYARAIQEKQPVVNGAQIRCERDDKGMCLEAKLCNARDDDDACYGTVSERAWSTPIYLSK